MAIVEGTVTVWTDASGAPERFVWEGTRYRVSDTPTPLDLDHPALTHPLPVPRGWRFQGTSERGDSRIFDVQFNAARQEWRVLRTYV